MPFQPNVGDEVVIDGVSYRFSEHPTLPGTAYAQAGGQGTVYQLTTAQVPGTTQVTGTGQVTSTFGSAGHLASIHALKVFTPAFRTARTADVADFIRPYATLPGLQVCARTVLAPNRHDVLLALHTDLTYAVLMPWVSGETWQEVLLSVRMLTPQQSRALAGELASVLATMEAQALAHCDLSGANVLVNTVTPSVALVDLEDMYAPPLPRPETPPTELPAYPHRGGPWELWGPLADRFPGALLLGEMLGWCDPRVRAASFGAQYFDPLEVGTVSERYRVLLDVLREHWGSDVALAFTRAWQSETPADCPPLGEWARLLSVPAAVVVEVTPPVEPVSAEELAAQARIEAGEHLLARGQIEQAVRELEAAYDLAPALAALPYARALMARGQANEQSGQLEEALSDYSAAHAVAPAGRLREELAVSLAAVAAQSERERTTLPVVLRQCPQCGQPVEEDWVSCPHCGFLLHVEPTVRYQEVIAPAPTIVVARRRPWGLVVALIATLLALAGAFTLYSVQATRTAQAQATATALALQLAGAQVAAAQTATANAQATGVALAQAGANAAVAATATAAVATANAQSTETAQALMTTATTQALAAQATAEALDATATAQGVAGEATTEADIRAATATADALEATARADVLNATAQADVLGLTATADALDATARADAAAATATAASLQATANAEAAQPVPTARVPGSTTVTVDARRGWQPTGVVVQAGQNLTIEVVAGQWATSPDRATLNAGQGIAYVCADLLPQEQCGEVLPSFPQGALVGQIGNLIFGIGTRISIDSQEAGELLLRINDGRDEDDLADNTGSLTVRLTLAP